MSSPLPESDPRVTVVVAAYNHAQLLPRCLDSLAAQQRPAEEIVVVDDGSTDETPVILAGRRIAGLRVLRQNNQGVSAARNYGLAAASGDLVLFLDADDALSSSALAALTVALVPAPSPDIVHGDWDFINDRSGRRLRQSSALGDQPISTLLCRNPLALHSVLVRRTSLLALGGFRDRQGALEDWELWLRMTLAGATFRHVPEVVAHYHWRPGSGSSRADRMHAVRQTVLAEQRAQAAERVEATVWREAEVNVWFDHAINLWRTDDLAGTAVALKEAARVRPGLLVQADTYYRLWRGDYLEALGDRDAGEAAARWMLRRRRMSALLPRLLDGVGAPVAADARSACSLALAQALREDGRPIEALRSLGRALRYRPRAIGRPRLLRLAGRSLMESLTWTRAGS